MAMTAVGALLVQAVTAIGAGPLPAVVSVVWGGGPRGKERRQDLRQTGNHNVPGMLLVHLWHTVILRLRGVAPGRVGLGPRGVDRSLRRQKWGWELGIARSALGLRPGGHYRQAGL